jgi:hypothetical protein
MSNTHKRKQFSQQFNAFHNTIQQMGGHAYNLLHNANCNELLQRVEEQLNALTTAAKAYHGDDTSTGTAASPATDATDKPIDPKPADTVASSATDAVDKLTDDQPTDTVAGPATDAADKPTDEQPADTVAGPATDAADTPTDTQSNKKGKNK